MKILFETDFRDTQQQFLHISCETEDGKYFDMLIDTVDDPYNVYYCGKKPENRSSFEKEIFAYLKSEYPDHF